MPIKWLALESINQRVYTHKSDVWSYGRLSVCMNVCLPVCLDTAWSWQNLVKDILSRLH